MPHNNVPQVLAAADAACSDTNSVALKRARLRLAAERALARRDAPAAARAAAQLAALAPPLPDTGLEVR